MCPASALNACFIVVLWAIVYVFKISLSAQTNLSMGSRGDNDKAQAYSDEEIGLKESKSDGKFVCITFI